MTIATLDELEKARAELEVARTAFNLAQVRAERDSARALLREAVPHIERAMAPYKDGWIEEKHDILARIAAALGDKS